MFRILPLTAMLSVVALLPADGQAQSTLPLSDSISVVGALVDPAQNGGSLILQTDANGNILNDNETTDPPGPFVNPHGPGGVFDPVALAADFSIDYQYVIRERSNTTQQSRTCYSFLQFDVSSLTVADVSDPTFQADFTIDYIGALNNLNGPGQYALGTPTSAWDSTTTIPTTLTGEGATLVAGAILVPDSLAATAGSVTVDITALVQGWVDGSIANNGVTFIETDGTVNIGDDVAGPTTSQSGYFSNAVVTTSVGGGMTLKGDVNLDGAVTFLDINPFIGVLSSNGFQAEADCNCDGSVSFLDISTFINILAGSP